MRLQGMIKLTVLGGVALVSVQVGSTVAVAQCPSCGSNHAVAGAPIVQAPVGQGSLGAVAGSAIPGMPGVGMPGVGVPGVGIPGVGIPGLSTMHQMTAQAAATHPGNTVAYGNVLVRGT